MNARVFDGVWKEVRDRYYDPDLHGVDWDAAGDEWRPKALAAINDRELYDAVRSMMRLLDDSHANVMDPAAARRQDAARQSRAVMGVTVALQDSGAWRIEQVRAGSPAEAAGVMPGWVLADVDDESWALDREVADGQPVRLGLLDDDGVRREITLTPRIMEPLPLFIADRTRPGVAVLTIAAFLPGLGRWMGEQLAAIPEGDAVILDLRSNPGGHMSEADAVLSCFLPRGRTWATQTARSGRHRVMRTGGGCGGLRRPATNQVVVLVDANSSSAAELTPAALQEAGRALIVGRKTAGAVLIAQEAKLPDGGRMILSRFDFVTVGGVRLEKRGVTPDLEAETSPQDRRARRDPALDAAVGAVGARREVPGSAAAEAA
ncbi:MULTISPECIES: S41 family peptidase [unclassified Brevundimonas]|uniref:S41 family peptidase n=1 Tax=unclassified Brevundimonas TaxID=2622653 RepID=UPI003F8F6646